MNKLNYKDPSENFLESAVELIKSGIESSRETKPKRSDDIYGQKLQLFTLKEEFQNDLLEVREKLSIPDHVFESFNDMSEWAGKILSTSEHQEKLSKEIEGVSDSKVNAVFGRNLHTLMDKFDIASRWSLTITAYLFFDRIEWHDLLPDPIEIGTPELSSRERGDYVDVRIYGEANKSDLEDKWKKIKKRRSFYAIEKSDILSSRKKQAENNQNQIQQLIDEYQNLLNQKNTTFGEDIFKRNIIALKLKRAGKSSKEIKDILVKNDLVEGVCTYSDVDNFLKDIRQKINNAELN
jgi:DNA-binding protein H-NS